MVSESLADYIILGDGIEGKRKELTRHTVTWDPTAINTTKITITGTYLNSTTNLPGDEAFTSSPLKTKSSFYAWKPNKGYLAHGTNQAVNVTLTLNTLSPSDDDDIQQTYTGPTLLLTTASTYHQPAPTLPSGAALYIALPTVLGFCLVMVFGVCLWNRKTRAIGLGNVMSRSRHGYGRAKRGAKRMAVGVGGRGARKERVAANIRMMENLPEEQVYRDEPAVGRGNGRREEYRYDGDAREVDMDGVGGGGRGRGSLDSDGLGSLAGTPTSERFPRQQGGNNVFREEVERQQRQR